MKDVVMFFEKGTGRSEADRVCCMNSFRLFYVLMIDRRRQTIQ